MQCETPEKEVKALQRPCCGLSVPKGSLEEKWGHAC